MQPDHALPAYTDRCDVQQPRWALTGCVSHWQHPPRLGRRGGSVQEAGGARRPAHDARGAPAEMRAKTARPSASGPMLPWPGRATATAYSTYTSVKVASLSRTQTQNKPYPDLRHVAARLALNMRRLGAGRRVPGRARTSSSRRSGSCSAPAAAAGSSPAPRRRPRGGPSAGRG